MSKELEEIIALVERAKEYCEERCLDNAIDKLRILAKPVHYVVRIEKLMSEPGQVFAYKAIHNNELLELHNNLERLKEEVFDQLEQAHKLTGLPPITMKQITFTEI